MITVNNLTKSFTDFTLSNITFDVKQGEYFVLLGKSGIGKTVILEMIAGLIRPDSGEIYINKKNITREKIQNRRLGYVYQTYNLFPHLTVRENIAYPLKCRGIKRTDRIPIIERIAEKTNITHLLNRSVHNLSGGESQRIAIARVLTYRPDCLLLDEPLGSLDIQAKGDMRRLLRKLHQAGNTIIHITHDYHEALALADRIAVLEDSGITQIGTPDEIFRRPKSEFVAKFIGMRNFYKGILHQEPHNTTASFDTGHIHFHVATGEAPGKGFIIIRSEDIILSKKNFENSALNHFRGTVIDIEPTNAGLEVTIDIGEKLTALITRESLKNLTIALNKKICVNIKASAIKFFNE